MDSGRGLNSHRHCLGKVNYRGEWAAADFTALGDNVNTAARLASNASQGEVLISEATYNVAQIENVGLEKRDLELKGKSELVTVRVLHT